MNRQSSTIPLTLLLTFILLILAIPASAQDDDTENIPMAPPEGPNVAPLTPPPGAVAESVIVIFEDGEMGLGAVSADSPPVAMTQAHTSAAVQAFGGTVRETYDNFPMMAVDVDAAGRAYIESLPGVVAVQENRVNYLALADSTDIIGADDPDGAGPRIGAWAAGYTGAGQAVAIIDNGFDTDHVMLNGKVVAEACFSGASSSVSNCPNGLRSQTGTGAASHEPCTLNSGSVCSHGTHVAGIAAGSPYSAWRGVAYDADLVLVNVFSTIPQFIGADVVAYDSDIIAGLDYVYQVADTYNISAVNMSLGGGRYFSDCDAIAPAYVAVAQQLESKDVAVIAASGNSGWADSISYPACVSNILAIGATDDNDNVPYFTNTATGMIDLMAPGEDIVSAYPGIGIGQKSGTSMAAPHIAGAWALFREAFPDASNTTILQRLQARATSVVEPDSGISFPRINIDLAIELETAIQNNGIFINEQYAYNALERAIDNNPDGTIEFILVDFATTGATLTVRQKDGTVSTAFVSFSTESGFLRFGIDSVTVGGVLAPSNIDTVVRRELSALFVEMFDTIFTETGTTVNGNVVLLIQTNNSLIVVPE